MSRVLLIGATLLISAAAPVAAQAPIDFSAGSSVRVLFADEKSPIEGSVVSAGRESFVFRPTGSDLRSSAYRSTAGQVADVSYGEVQVLWVDLGRSRKHSAWRGALWGAYLGASGGAISGPFVAKSGDYSIGQASAGLGIGAGLIGAGIGAVVGAIVAPEQRWKSYRFVTH